MTVRKINSEEIDRLNPLFCANDQELFMLQRVSRIRAGACDIYILEDGDLIIGEVTIVYDIQEYEDYTIANQRVYAEALRVLPKYQGRGLGQFLMREVIKLVREEGYTEMVIGVEDDNLNAKHIYAKLGFNEFIRRDKGAFEDDHYEYNVFMKRL
jgi:Acetyltransferases